MRKCIRWTVALALAGTIAQSGDQTRSTVRISTSEGRRIQLLAEDLSGLKSRPLVKMRKVLDKKFRKGFFSLFRVRVDPGTELVGECNVVTVPCRLTVYEISKRAGFGRELRVVATGYHDKQEKAVFRKKIEKLEENVFFITAEQVNSPNELNSHLRYMKSQGNTILLKGYGTNWNLSVLKLKMEGKVKGRPKKKDAFEKDGRWLVGQLLNPLWVMSIRIEAK